MALSITMLVALVRELFLFEADEVLRGDVLPDSPEQHEERRVAIARRLYDEYRRYVRRELGGLIAQLPWKASDKDDYRTAELIKLRQWATRQLGRVKRVNTQDADVLRMFVYMSLRSVCDWERIHVDLTLDSSDNRTDSDGRTESFTDEDGVLQTVTVTDSPSASGVDIRGWDRPSSYSVAKKPVRRRAAPKKFTVDYVDKVNGLAFTLANDGWFHRNLRCSTSVSQKLAVRAKEGRLVRQ
jgi:hypothetical protein